MTVPEKKCAFPRLPSRYDTALRAAVAWVLSEYPEVLGIIASGTIVRGTPDPSSDLDIYVLHAADWRQRVQRLFNGVPAEIFVNPPAQVERYFAEEREEGRPTALHMVGTGFVVLSRDPVVEDLRRRAREELAAPPPAPADLTVPRYMAACLFEDAVDVRHRDPRTARMILSSAVEQMLRLAFAKEGRWTPRTKDLQRDLASVDPGLARLARRFYRAPTLAGQLRIGGLIADQVIGARGFFEWASRPDPVG
jgi:predicted nucleotidyltransferase